MLPVSSFSVQSIFPMGLHLTSEVTASFTFHVQLVHQALFSNKCKTGYVATVMVMLQLLGEESRSPVWKIIVQKLEAF